MNDSNRRPCSTSVFPLSNDAFGKGTASLAWLGQLRLHQIKIEKNFVQRIMASHNDSRIARASINLATIRESR